MAGKASWIWMSLALIVAALALGWPLIEEKLIVKGGGCPWPFNMFHTPYKSVSTSDAAAQDATTAAAATEGGADGAAETANLKVYTLEELRKYDGTDKDLPILLAIGGKVVDVTTGAKFYGVGKTYHQFAGTACTRALALSSLDKKDINDDISDLTPEQLQEMEETKNFYYDKYKVVGVLAN